MVARFGHRTETSPRVSQWLNNPGLGYFARTVQTFSSPVSVTSDLSNNVKGSWVEVIASTSSEADRIDVSVFNVSISGNATATLLDIGFGAAGNETVVISNVAVGGASNQGTNTGICFSVPVYVPPSTRIAVRIQTSTGNRSASVAIALAAGPNPGVTSKTTTTIGTSTSTSRGTNIGVAANTWYEIVAATTSQYENLTVVPSFGLGGVTTQGVVEYVFGFGPSGSEETLLTIPCFLTTTERISAEGVGDKMVRSVIPAGTRLVGKIIGNNSSGMEMTVVATETLGI